jgi:toxin ParE1/3/4
MQLRWTEQAADDLGNIVNYLFEHAPEHADRIARTIYNAPASLLTFPYRGRLGRKEGTRELVLLPLPYIVVYQVREEIIYLVRILHAAQEWPQ